jgi:peptidoglycan/xylan/chitin deacetylase (PgdA/CDA1 family)
MFRTAVGAALLVSLYAGLVATGLPVWPSSGTAAGSNVVTPLSSALPAVPGSAGPVIGEASPGPTGSVGTAGRHPGAPGPSAEAPRSTPSELWTPPVFTPSPRSTPEPDRLYHVPILMYHRIVPTAEAGDSMSDLVVPPETFSAQLRAFSEAGWHTITMATLADDMATDRTIPARTFVITIDDGWYDGYTYAFPIMRDYGFVATFYVISSRIDAPDFLSAAQLRALEAAGNDIGNHTVNHVSLQTVSMSEVHQEVEAASEQIARAVGHRPVTLSYPMGGISDAAVYVVSQIPDLEIAVTTGYGQTETWLQRYDTPRVRIHPSTNATLLIASLSY